MVQQKGLFVSCDGPMAQFIINLNATLPHNQKFIIHVLDSTHLFIKPDMAGTIRTAISEFRDQNTYEKPSAA
ncbi:general transcription factor [Lithospermum erythrorhizon]|uniref:General transcription and DNA repair factor IIH subunit TFB5 n=1 Tax=Lithospermum erythrorhizon TaxID=34254 RepID=A0AAV3QI64_LITER